MKHPPSYETDGLVKYFLASELPEEEQARFKTWSQGYGQPQSTPEDAHFWVTLEKYLDAIKTNRFTGLVSVEDLDISDEELKQFMQLLIERDDIFSKVKGLAHTVIMTNSERSTELTPQVRLMVRQLMSELGPKVW